MTTKVGMLKKELIFVRGQDVSISCLRLDRLADVIHYIWNWCM